MNLIESESTEGDIDMENQSNRSMRGQALVIVAIILIVLVGMLMLVIDGGAAYANRRATQNAADAAALAGAEELCKGNTAAVAQAAANTYATVNNRATSAESAVAGQSITVTAHLRADTFFAQVFGYNTITTTATAAAGCFTPCGATRLIPVAWMCHPPAGSPPGTQCAMSYGTLDTPGPTYIIMDSSDDSVDLSCQDPITHLPSTALDCDFNNDGVNDALSNGERSWMDLSGGGGGASELSSWIRDGVPFAVQTHTWFGSQTGGATSIYDAAKARLGDVLFLPVFDQMSPDVPDQTCTNPPCAYTWHHPEDQIVLSGGTSRTYYHIYNYSAFREVCVDAPPHALAINASFLTADGRTCKGKDAVVTVNNMNPGDANKLNTIEGYFLQDYDPYATGKCGEGASGTGVYTIYLK